MPKIDAKEFTDRVYDMIAGNVGMSEYHVAIKPGDITQCEVNAPEGKMFFKVGRRVFKLTVQEVNPNYFKTYEE